jgi:hypothetical protein
VRAVQECLCRADNDPVQTPSSSSDVGVQREVSRFPCRLLEGARSEPEQQPAHRTVLSPCYVSRKAQHYPLQIMKLKLRQEKQGA